MLSKNMKFEQTNRNESLKTYLRAEDECTDTHKMIQFYVGLGVQKDPM